MRFDSELPEDALRELVAEFKAEIRERKGTDFPEDPYEQLMAAVAAVFRSWDNDRAIAYRQLYGYPSEWGTAVSVQAMVFGNLGEDSGTGVAFTRNPATGDDRFYGEFLVNAQGEDVVAGIRTPQKIAELAARWPDIARQLEDVRERARAALPGDAGHRVHDRAGQALRPADPHREAHRPRRGPHRGRHGRRAAHHEGAGAPAHRARGAEPPAPPDLRR